MFEEDGIDILQQVAMLCFGNFWFVGDLEDCEPGRAGEPSINSTRAIKYGNLLSAKPSKVQEHYYYIRIGSVCHKRALKEIISFPDIKRNIWVLWW